MSEIVESRIVRIGRKNTLVIPKVIAERLGVGEGDRVLLILRGDRMELKPLPNAITLSLRGEKVARITLRELEEESARVQEEYAEKA